ncbi:urease accessory protein UreJ [Advenella sp. S44]|uniref:HupE/UreJ family protein n=1 Tax=Advenella sp. S44 TaxID=1982755 RepID=UPI000C2A6509|nr:HupE/UreJ family protein [Advenella sp. S44]PJX23817.1 urease accessory protein UreJ [Advenella sp. S44]
MIQPFSNQSRCSLAALALAGLPLATLAHPGHFEHVDPMSMFNEGLLHPLTGPDHLLAMLAVGIWSAMAYPSLKRAIYIPLSFSSILLVGALLGMAGMQIPLVEPLIMASLLVLGLMLAGMARLSLATGSALVAFFAFFHGAAHGMELPEGGAASLFILGFMLSTLFIHCVGMIAGAILARHRTWMARLTGAGIASYGAVLFLTVQ